MPLMTFAQTIEREYYLKVSAQLDAMLVTLEKLKRQVEQEEAIASILSDLKKVLVCESGLQHYRKDGSVLRSPTNDYGIMQINAKSHLKTARNLGYDIMDLADNIRYGMLLYRNEGLKPWVCARKLGMI